MPPLNKIERYNLVDRILALSGQGKNTYEIATILIEEAEGKYSISQPTVARFLKGVRKDRSEQTRQIVQDYIKATVPADLDSINEVQVWLISQFRSIESMTKEAVSEALGKPISEKMFNKLREIFPSDPLDLRTKAEIGMKIIRIVDVKLKYAGILEPTGASGTTATDPIDLDEFRMDQTKKGAVNE